MPPDRARALCILVSVRGQIPEDMKAAVIRRLAVTDAVLAGFSHEAFHALEIAFSVLAAPDAIVAFTGCRVGKVDDHRPDRLPPA